MEFRILGHGIPRFSKVETAFLKKKKIFRMEISISVFYIIFFRYLGSKKKHEKKKIEFPYFRYDFRSIF
jgi:hypothetical protein